MIDIERLLSTAHQRAVDTDSDDRWNAADRLAIELSENCSSSLSDLKVLIEHAIRRLGGDCGRPPFDGCPSEVWIEAVLMAIYRGLRVVEAIHTNFQSPILLSSIGPGSVIVGVSDAWAAQLGYKPAEVIGRLATDFLTDESKIEAQTRWLPIFWKTGCIHGARYTYLSKSGKRFPVELSAIAQRDADGVIQRSLAVISKR